jgi:hypothetical protein
MGVVVPLLAEDTTLTCDPTELSRWAAAGAGEIAPSPDRWVMPARNRADAVDVSKWAMVFAAVVFCLDVILRRWAAVASLWARRRNA